MSNLITTWRRMVADSGTAVWSNDDAQELLDEYRRDLWSVELMAVPQPSAGSTVYQRYLAGYSHLEGTASGTAAFRLFDSNGTVISDGFTLDARIGQVAFTANQAGSVRYADVRTYDLNAAAAAAWREAMASKASLYKFSADGASYNREQWFEHCGTMAAYYDGLSGPSVSRMLRSDLA
jgi:hypothetical protein